MTVARIWFKNGYLVPCHSHELEQITQVVSGILRFRLGAGRPQTVEIGPGEVLVIPPNVRHEGLCLGEVEEIDMWASTSRRLAEQKRRLPAAGFG